MTNRSDIEHVLDRYLAEGGEQLPDRVLDAVLDQIDYPPQRHALSAPWRSRAMSPLLKPLLAAVAVVAVIVVGASFLTGRPAGLPTPTPTSTPEPTVSAWDLPALTLPGARGGAPGEYGWTGRPGGGGAGMHWVTGEREAAAMRFGNRDSCFGSSDAAPVAVTVAGYEGAYLEPYEPPVTFIGGVGDETTRAYELKIGSSNLCVYVTWHATTTADERDAALGILDTIRAEHREDGSIRIVFTLTDSWDTG